ncbi:MAG TPA: dethiobiotin synthase [Solirubrobacteraceae bacterium]
MPPRGLFVTGTDTGAGKSVLSACLVAAMRAAGERVRPYKPVLTGLDERPGEWPADHELLATAAGTSAERVAPLRFGPAVSPHLAAELAGRPIDPSALLAAARSPAAAEGEDEDEDEGEDDGEILIVEGVGGLLVPLAESFSVRDLAAALALPLIIAARPGLGTINHTLLTIEAADAAGLDVRAVVLSPWPEEPTPMEASNRRTIAALGGVEVATLPRVAGFAPAELAAAGAALPIDRWLGEDAMS